VTKALVTNACIPTFEDNTPTLRRRLAARQGMNGTPLPHEERQEVNPPPAFFRTTG
jgi:hypothetical protein